MSHTGWKIRYTVDPGSRSASATTVTVERYATEQDATIAACRTWSSHLGRTITGVHISDGAGADADAERWIEVAPSPCCTQPQPRPRPGPGATSGDQPPSRKSA